MKLSNLKKIDYYEVEQYLTEQLQLTAYQKQRMRDHDVLRTSPFYFYKREKHVPVKWHIRLTLPIYCLFILLLIICLPLKFLITGQWRYSNKRFQKFMVEWSKRLKVDSFY